MKAVKFIITGVLFGIVMTKSEAASWFRIQEMFRFQSFHMFGIIGTAVILGAASTWMIKKFGLRDFKGEEIQFHQKDRGWRKYLFGGMVFGLGWALTGACPGPIFVNIGHGYAGMGVVSVGALAGTYLYGLIRERLPH